MLSPEPFVRLACLTALTRLFKGDNDDNGKNSKSDTDAIVVAAADDDTLGEWLSG